MAKILVTPVEASGAEPYILEGPMTVKEFERGGRIYYIAGDSVPEEIVTVLDE